MNQLPSTASPSQMQSVFEIASRYNQSVPSNQLLPSQLLPTAPSSQPHSTGTAVQKPLQVGPLPASYNPSWFPPQYRAPVTSSQQWQPPNVPLFPSFPSLPTIPSLSSVPSLPSPFPSTLPMKPESNANKFTQYYAFQSALPSFPLPSPFNYYK